MSIVNFVVNFSVESPIPNTFPELREKYARFFAGDVAAPPPGWLGVLEFALDELSQADDADVVIQGLRPSTSGLLPYFASGNEKSKRLLMELLAEAVHYCPFCGQSYQQAKEDA